MKNDLRVLLAEVGKKMKQEPRQLATELDDVSARLSRHHINLSGASLRKLWEVVSGKRKLSNETLNRLALFAGFQDWHDFRDALHGDVDASVNYEQRKGGHQ
jgi:hypothetical protein